MGNPVWLEVCSCGDLTGNMTIAVQAPQPGNPRPGHGGHTVVYEMLCEDGARMTDDERERFHEAAETFRRAATNPMRMSDR